MRNYTLLYSGDYKQGRNSPTFVVDQELKDETKQFQGINGRLSYI